MLNTKLIVLLCLLTGVSVFHSPIFATENSSSNLVPRTNLGKKWRIGYYEGGEYSDYQKSLVATIKSLMEKGWIEKNIIQDPSTQETKQLWKWLVRNAKSDYIHFVEDAHYSAGWDKIFRERIAEEIIGRLNEKKDIDLMIAMGTWAGQDLANNRHSTATVVMSTSDPLKAQIVRDSEYSGYDHVFARIDPHRYERQLRIFHDIVGFRRLGVAYENTAVGEIYTALDSIEKVATERGFEIAKCFTLSDTPDRKRAEETVKECFHVLAKNVDAIYVTAQGGVNIESIPELAGIANSYRIPTFSQAGSKEVEHGILLTAAPKVFDPVGRYYSEVLAKLFNGATPGQLNQVFEDSPSIALNLKTAGIIGFYLTADLLSAADTIYREIKKPD